MQQSTTVMTSNQLIVFWPHFDRRADNQTEADWCDTVRRIGMRFDWLVVPPALHQCADLVFDERAGDGQQHQ